MDNYQIIVANTMETLTSTEIMRITVMIPLALLIGILIIVYFVIRKRKKEIHTELSKEENTDNKEKKVSTFGEVEKKTTNTINLNDNSIIDNEHVIINPYRSEFSTDDEVTINPYRSGFSTDDEVTINPYRSEFSTDDEVTINPYRSGFSMDDEVTVNPYTNKDGFLDEEITVNPYEMKKAGNCGINRRKGTRTVDFKDCDEEETVDPYAVNWMPQLTLGFLLENKEGETKREEITFSGSMWIGNGLKCELKIEYDDENDAERCVELTYGGGILYIRNIAIEQSVAYIDGKLLTKELVPLYKGNRIEMGTISVIVEYIR